MVSAPVVSGLDEVVAAWAHSGQAAALVRSLKYGRATALVTQIADQLAVIAPPADVVTWIPSTARHRRRRGFDPSELLARAVARRRGLRARRLIRRGDDTAQTGRDRAGRLTGPELVPAGRNRSSLRPRVLVVDDVCTTGSTLRAAAAALTTWGAGSVVAVVVTAVNREADAWVPVGHPYACASSTFDQEVEYGRLHQQPADASHAEAGGGSQREDWSPRPISRRTRHR